MERFYNAITRETYIKVILRIRYHILSLQAIYANEKFETYLKGTHITARVVADESARNLQDGASRSVVTGLPDPVFVDRVAGLR